MDDLVAKLPLLQVIIDRVGIGIVVVDREHNIVVWNSFMESYSEVKAKEVLGKNLFTSFPELPRNWLERKIQNVFMLKNFSFTSWEHRPYLFRFQHNRPITGGAEHMRQNCTFLPIKNENNNEIDYVCITLFDATDISVYENMLKEAVKSLAKVSNQDSLTGVYNRRYLEISMGREFNRAQRYGHPFSAIILDLDHFKNINDSFGHAAGDEVLKVISARIHEALRTPDTLGRFGGEEFVIVLPETDLASAASIAERLRKTIEEKPVIFQNDMLYEDIEIKVSASIGVTSLRNDTLDYQTMIQEADTALYQSKEHGRNQVTIFSLEDLGSAPLPEVANGDTDPNDSKDSEPSENKVTNSNENARADNVIYITVGHKEAS